MFLKKKLKILITTSAIYFPQIMLASVVFVSRLKPAAKPNYMLKNVYRNIILKDSTK